MIPMTPESFLNALRQYRLLSAEQLESLRTLVREHVQSGPLPAEPGA